MLRQQILETSSSLKIEQEQFEGENVWCVSLIHIIVQMLLYR